MTSRNLQPVSHRDGTLTLLLTAGREYDAILAGARLLAAKLADGSIQPDDGDVGGILTCGGEHAGMTAEEIHTMADHWQGDAFTDEAETGRSRKVFDIILHNEGEATPILYTATGADAREALADAWRQYQDDPCVTGAAPPAWTRPRIGLATDRTEGEKPLDADDYILTRHMTPADPADYESGLVTISLASDDGYFIVSDDGCYYPAADELDTTSDRDTAELRVSEREGFYANLGLSTCLDYERGLTAPDDEPADPDMIERAGFEGQEPVGYQMARGDDNIAGDDDDPTGLASFALMSLPRALHELKLARQTDHDASALVLFPIYAGEVEEPSFEFMPGAEIEPDGHGGYSLSLPGEAFPQGPFDTQFEAGEAAKAQGFVCEAEEADQPDVSLEPAPEPLTPEPLTIVVRPYLYDGEFIVEDIAGSLHDDVAYFASKEQALGAAADRVLRHARAGHTATIDIQERN